ncbi:PTS fructose transporter subunit IIA [Pontibacillus chungwhensis BH030062]|uniref:PTS fructose transporter subunit IIA n=1 Tax=Pontibacillus chungwhensis BH030062 TaxID=1385513 RepID=A0A0A2VD48_9BACI|nr:fructose-specific PTS transporter subunit EIIC [Pontibacillus chungwhensis]KGP91585.1 PTS fructose transporter subunit IIA [Pontibacillus chungwhensis BH030062]
MKITDLLKQDTMILELESSAKADVIDELVSKLDEAGRLNDKEEFKQAILAREEQSTTGIGEGVAIPHAKTAAVKEPAIAFARSQEGADYESLDGQPTHLFFMIAASEGANQAHLETLSSLSSLLMDTEFRQKLLNAETRDEIVDLIDAKEKANSDEEEAEQAANENEKQDASSEEEPYVIAVTACPTGIAHTYMAADKLKETAKEMGVKIKVETNGSSGVKNALTKEDIERASGVIVAADIEVETDRFKGKPVVMVPVAKGIHEPKELITKAKEGDAPEYQGSGQSSNEDGEGSGEKTGIYKHLMNGVSNMLPFVVGGGILIALSFLFGINAANPDSDQYNRFAEMLSIIGGGKAFYLLVPVLAGFIAQSIAGRPGLAPGMVGGLIATTTGAADGGSGFLGGLLAGFLAGYLMLLIQKGLKVLPDVLDGLKPVLLYPVLGLFFTGIIMLLVNPFLVSIYTALRDGLDSLGSFGIVVGLIIGGMMAVDMGGPVNKAAYTFGIAMLDAGNTMPIAAAMAGGMVPPLGLALATTFFRNKFTAQERETGKTAYAMGATFITEGVIPFAAADPGRVIPASVIGSTITGGLVYLFNLNLLAPHGGIIVILTGAVKTGGEAGNALLGAVLYIAAVLIGAIVTAIIAGVLKKPVQKG